MSSTNIRIACLFASRTLVLISIGYIPLFLLLFVLLSYPHYVLFFIFSLLNVFFSSSLLFFYLFFIPAVLSCSIVFVPANNNMPHLLYYRFFVAKHEKAIPANTKIILNRFLHKFSNPLSRSEYTPITKIS